MAKRTGKARRKMGRYIRGAVDEDLTFAGLAAHDVVGAIFDEVVNGRTLVSSIVATYNMEGFTPTSDVGPVLVGIAHGDYTDAEIEEFLEATGSWDEGDKIEQERSKRKIRRIGVFSTPALATQGVTLNEGRPLKSKLNWILNDGEGLRLWVYNMGTAAVATTTPIVHMQGHANLWPR